MNISSLNFPKAGLYQTNVQAQNTRAPKMRELTCDTVSFGKNEDSGQYPASSVPSELLKGLEILYKYDYNKRFSDGSFKDKGKTALMYLLSYNDTKSLLDIAKLFGKETLKQVLTYQDVDGNTALFHASIAEQTKALLDAAPDDETLKEMLLKQDQYTGKTLLMKSPTSFQSMLLLDAAPDDETRRKMLTQKCSDGKTAYNYASYHQEKFLLNQAYRLGVYDL